MIFFNKMKKEKTNKEMFSQVNITRRELLNNLDITRIDTSIEYLKIAINYGELQNELNRISIDSYVDETLRPKDYIITVRQYCVYHEAMVALVEKKVESAFHELQDFINGWRDDNSLLSYNERIFVGLWIKTYDYSLKQYLTQ